MHEYFHRFSNSVSRTVGSVGAFLVALGVVLAWAVTGPLFHFSDTWQLFINTGTTVVTFLMVFLIQHSQNRDAKAIQLKLDELLRGVRGARNRLVHLEDLSDRELEDLRQEFQQFHEEARKTALEETRKATHATGSPR